MRKLLILSAIGLSSGLPLRTAHAVVLEQKWTAGDKAAYAMTLSGTVNLQAPADAPVLWAGIPLEVDIHGQGKTVVQTLDVDGDGTARVTYRVVRLSITGEALGQKGEFRVEDGTPRLFLNGKSLVLDKVQTGPKKPPGANGAVTNNAPARVDALVNPPVALRLNRQGRLTGIDPLTPAPPAAAGQTATVAGAINRTAMAQAMLLRAMPALWPDRDVNIGDSWDVVVGWPAAPGSAADGAAAAPPLGRFKLTLKGTDVADGLTLYKVGIDGGVVLDQIKLKQINAAGAGSGVGLGILTNAKQSIKGDLWFDADAGQVRRGDFVISASMAGRGRGVKGQPGEESWTDFTGNVKLERQADDGN